MKLRRVLTLVCAAAVIALGVWLQSVAWAGRSAMILQVIGGFFALALIAVTPRLSKRFSGASARLTAAILCLGLLLLPILQPGIEGVHRWLHLGPLAIQPLPLVLPLLVWMAARDDVADPRWSAPGPMGLALAGPALALQPDQQGATAVLVVSLAMLLPWNSPVGVNAPRRWLVAALGLGSAIVTALRPTNLAPVAHVEGVINVALGLGPGLGALALLGLVATIALIAAAAWISARDLSNGRAGLERTGWLLTVVWAALAVSALGGAYPVPVIGFGLSWVIGWGLALGLARAERERI